MVIHDEDAHRGQITLWLRRGDTSQRLRCQARRKPEGVALSRLALDPDLSTHQFRELLANRQSQACSAILVGDGAVRLAKGLEEV